MYIPEAFKVVDAKRLHTVIERHSFATLVTTPDGVPFASHLPLLFDATRGAHGTLIGHMARANPQWQHFRDGREALAIFQGPHGYISPTWYATAPAVPTWNYVAIHAYGIPRLVTDEGELAGRLDELIQKYESALPIPWSGELPAEFKAKLLQAIVGFEIPVTRIEGKFKLGQNRAAADVAKVCSALQADNPGLAQAMRDVTPQ